MTSKDYTRTRFIQFLQQTLSKNKSNNIYFDLYNDDKLFIDLKAQDGTTKVMLISSSRLRSDMFLWEAKLWDFDWITLFVNYIDSLLDRYKAKKSNSVLNLDINYNFDDINNDDFDNL